MFITRKHLSRRALLRSTGSAVALPFLDAMVPALAQGIRRIPRLGFLYVPHGAVMSQWTPAQTGRDFRFAPILQPLSPWRDKLNIVSGLSHRLIPREGAHTAGPATWLSGVRPRRTRSASIKAGVTADQIAARHIGGYSRIKSMQLAAEQFDASAALDRHYHPLYASSLSWDSTSHPLLMHTRPRYVFERIFNVRGRCNGVLDNHLEQIGSLFTRLGHSDQLALERYLDEVRDVEQRIFGENHISLDFGNRVDLMFRLIALAWQSDTSRVFTFMMAREASKQRYPQIGIDDEYHAISHHQNRADKIRKCASIQRYHTSLFSSFIERLGSIADGDGSLLDNSLVLYGSSMSNSNAHNNSHLPVALIGGAGGRIKAAGHTRQPENTPMSNLLLRMLQESDIPIATLGDSTGTVSIV